MLSTGNLSDAFADANSVTGKPTSGITSMIPSPSTTVDVLGKISKVINPIGIPGLPGNELGILGGIGGFSRIGAFLLGLILIAGGIYLFKPVQSAVNTGVKVGTRLAKL